MAWAEIHLVLVQYKGIKMSIPPYIKGYPPDGSSLGQTKSTIRNNLDGTFETLAVDHINNNGQPGMNPAGYHNIAHFVPQGSDPAAITGFGQLYSKTINDYTNDQALFWETGEGLIQQLTVNLTPIAGDTGSTFLPGGIILQWGTITTTGNQSSTVTFATLGGIEFPNNCFTMQTTANSSSDSVITLNVSSLTNAGFSYANTSGSTRSFFWWAIGN
jgi:hypothetical protein